MKPINHSDFSSNIVNNTLVDYPRLQMLRDLLKETVDIEGAIAEVGVYKGGTAYLICEAAPLTNKFFFDTFEGMPTTDDKKDWHKQGDFADTSLNQVSRLLDSHGHWWVTSGIFPAESGSLIKDKTFRLVHIDVDIYTSVRDCLEFFHPRMAKGGIIVLDDHLAPSCPGAKLAADEFSIKYGTTVEPTIQSQAIIRY